MRRVRAKRNQGNVLTDQKANFNRRHTKMKLGDYLVQCDVTGQVCFASETSFTWRGTRVSNQNWDPRHPQLDIYITGDEDISVSEPRPFQGEDETLNSDITESGTANISDADVDVGASGFFTIANDGTLDLNGTPVTGEWWSEGATTDIGNFYQVRIGRTSSSGSVDSISGITNVFNSLANDKTVNVSFSGVGNVDFYVEIRSIISDEIVATASIILRRT